MFHKVGMWIRNRETPRIKILPLASHPLPIGGRNTITKLEQMQFLHLHVLGPAFGLPSIDAECIAAAALLRLYVEEGWTISPSHDQARRLPRLIDGHESIYGFSNIAKHLGEKYPDHLYSSDQAQRAHSTAISSFSTTTTDFFPYSSLLSCTFFVSFSFRSETTRPGCEDGG